ncbi:MAG: glycoside hydrolase family 26 protein, partial [Ruminococcus sp.]|nr:glycoside hydrolase family 26 protein [Ruminococcus sp.]
MRKRSIAVICAILFTFAALTACENKKSSSSDGEKTDTVSSAEHKLSNPNANAEAVKTYDYLCSSFGKVILSCQQESTWMGSPDYEMKYIEEVTGKLPAMRGLDFMNNDFDGVVEPSK